MNLNSFLLPVLPKFPNVREDADVEILQELPIETLYLALKKADSDSLAWFLNNAMPEQIQGIIDIDCWNGATFLPERFETIFRGLMSVHPVKLLQVMKKIDPEVLTRGLLELCSVVDFDATEPPEMPEENFIISPDSKYMLIFENADPEAREVLQQWMRKLATVDIELMRLQLEACKWEQKSDLEEFGYQMKRGRLEDMGFVDREEAMALYSRGNGADVKKKLLLNPFEDGTKRAALVKRTDDDEAPEASSLNEALLPEILSQPLFGEGFFSECLSRVTDPALRNLLLAELLRTLNAALAADEVIHSDIEVIGRAAQRARRYVDLGLAYLADGKIETGERMLENYPFGEVFRLGWLVIQDLVNVGRELRKRYPTGVFGERDTALLEALEGRHPELDATQRKDVGLLADTLLTLDSALIVGTRLTILNPIGTFFTKDLAAALGLETIPLKAGESGYARLLAGLFREASGASLKPRPLTPKEWDELTPPFKAQDGETALRTAAKLVAERCPMPARKHFEARLSASIDELVNFIKAKGSARPDSRFFKAVAFMEEPS